MLLATASFLLVFPLVDGRTQGWPTWMFALLAASVPMLALFVLQQRARLRAGRAPLVEFSVLRKRSYVSGIVFTLVFFGSIVGFSLTTGLFLQIGLGFDRDAREPVPRRDGGRRVLRRRRRRLGRDGSRPADPPRRPGDHGRRVARCSTSRSGSADGSVGFGSLAPGLFVFGLGMGMIFVPLFSIIMGEIDDHEVGSAAGLLESLQQLGAALGVAALGTLFFDGMALEDGGPQAAMAAGRHLVAAEHTLLAVIGVIAFAWAIGWLLPRRARAMS